MELLASFLNPTQMGHLREASKDVSLDDVAEVATTGFRSIGSQREDSLVFVLGLLNLGTVLCYAVYAQLFKPIRRGLPQMDDNTFVFKKIQTILDELVLHVHTTTYYKSSLEKSQELARKGLGDSTFRGRSGAALSSSSFQSVFSFFDLPEPSIYGEKEPPPLPLTASSRTAEEFEGYLQEEAKKLVHEWLSFLIQSSVMPTTGRLTKRHTRMQFPHTYRRNATGRRPSVPQIKNRVPAPLTQPMLSNSPAVREPQQQPQKWNRERASQRRPQIKRPVAADAEADGQVSASDEPSVISSRTGPDVPHPTHQDDPVLPVHALFPQETVREANSNYKSGRSSSRSGTRRSESEIRRERNEETKTIAPEPRHIPSEFHHQQQQMYRNPVPDPSYNDMEESATMSNPVEEDGMIVRLMHLIQQTTPLAMDVLGVYKSKNDGQHHSSTEPKCLERLLCQLNQDWKSRGSVPAAMAPFLSISMAWMTEKSSSPNLSHVLMAVRAGWIGKQCATLYPRCANPGRPQWTVTPLHDDSLNLPSIGQPPVKVRPPLNFFASTPTPAPSSNFGSTQRPFSSSIRTIPSTKPLISQSSESSDLRTTPLPSMLTNDGNRKTDKLSPPEWVRDSGNSDTNNPAKGVWGHHSIELNQEQETSSTLIGTSLQVDKNGGNSNGGNSNDRIDTNPKPWGKPSRFAGSDNVELSDIVRGVYPQATEKTQTDDDEEEEYDGEEEGEEEEEEEEEEETETSSKKPATQIDQDSILHDLNANHFAQNKPVENVTKIKDIYEEIQKKKTDRLEMVPHRGLVHPWLSEPVWVPENSWQSKTDGNRLRSDEDYEEATDRHRDRVSFSHEDAVKDVRLFDFAMQYLRDRSA